MNWNAASAARLAREGCRLCGGSGIDPLAPAAGSQQEWDPGDFIPCACVCRAVFRACYRRFRQCAAASGATRAVTFSESPRGVDRHLVWVRRLEDYCADFESAARRSLSAEQLRLFRYHHVLGASPELAARRMGISERHFFRLLAELECAVGREFALMTPYSVYPPREYLSPQRHPAAR